MDLSVTDFKSTIEREIAELTHPKRFQAISEGFNKYVCL